MAKYSVSVNGEEYEVTLLSRERSHLSFSVAGETYSVDVAPILSEHSQQASAPISIQAPIKAATKKSSAPGEIAAPMPGIIVQIPVAVGDSVTQGQTVAVVEAMKMENNVAAGTSGKVKKIHVSAGEEVNGGQVLVTLD